MIRKILFCSPQSSAFTKPVNSALLRLGYDTKIFDFQKGNIVSRTMGFTINKLKAKHGSLHDRVNIYINKQLIQLVHSWKPDVVFIIKGNNITRETLLEIGKTNSLRVNWYADWMVVWDWIKTHSPYYDYFFNMCLDVEKAMIKKHPHTAFILPAAAIDEKINNIRNYPITFIGQYSQRREKYFKRLEDLGLKIWGYEGWQKSSLKEIASSSISNDECLNIIRHSKIAVNILTGEDSFEPEAINVRTFEALGTGTFLLVHNHPLLHKYFKPGRDFVTFNTPEDLRKKTIYYLQHEKERNSIALHGWNTVKKYHTYDIRLKELFKQVPL